MGRDYSSILSLINVEAQTEAYIMELKKVKVKFLNRRLQREIDKLWDAGIINEKVIEEWSKEHMRI